MMKIDREYQQISARASFNENRAARNPPGRAAPKSTKPSRRKERTNKTSGPKWHHQPLGLKALTLGLHRRAHVCPVAACTSAGPRSPPARRGGRSARAHKIHGSEWPENRPIGPPSHNLGDKLLGYFSDILWLFWIIFVIFSFSFVYFLLCFFKVLFKIIFDIVLLFF